MKAVIDNELRFYTARVSRGKWREHRPPCNTCGRSVRFLRAGRPHPSSNAALRSLGIRCGDCLTVFCLPCAWKHFRRTPPWAKKRGLDAYDGIRMMPEARRSGGRKRSEPHK